MADQTSDVDAQSAFVAHYDDIDRAMQEGGKGSAELRHASAGGATIFVQPVEMR